MSRGNRPENRTNTDIERSASPDLYDASHKNEHTARFSDLEKREIADTEGGEALEEADLFEAKRYHLEDSNMSRNAQPDQKWANNQQKEDSQGQGFDEMEIDNNKNDGELDSKL